MLDRFVLFLKKVILVTPLILFVVVIVYLFSPHGSLPNRNTFFAPRAADTRSAELSDDTDQPQLTPAQEHINEKVSQGAVPTRGEFDAVMDVINTSVSGSNN